VCVISRNIIFWAPTVGFGHRRSCFSATTFRLYLKSIGRIYRTRHL
jgi:hypothetical protein